jgi:hypothetical protein
MQEMRRLILNVELDKLENGDPLEIKGFDSWTPFFIEAMGGVFRRGDLQMTTIRVWLHRTV